MDPKTLEATLQEAARWHARLQAADCTPQDRIDFDQWRHSDAAHAQAFALAELTHLQLNRLAADPRLQAMAQTARSAAVDDERRGERRDEQLDEQLNVSHAPFTQATIATDLPPSTRGTPRHRPRWFVPAALAATAAVAALTLHVAPDIIDSEPASIAYDAPPDRTRTVTLADGSIVQLDVASRIQVSLRDDQRLVTLQSGRAVFEVAHDRSRPFSVTAGNTRTTALGTRFQVQLDTQQVLVTLTQGSVAIDNAQPRSGAAHDWHEQLRPGEQLRLDTRTATRQLSIVDTGAVTSWTRGRHLFRGTPLREALDEVNRYAHKKVRLGDPSLADMPVGGNFIAGDSELIVAAFAAVLPLSVVDGNREIILFRCYDSPP
jgi:transmembrane sensor